MSGKLNARKLISLSPAAGRRQADFADGGGLILRVFAASGARTWIYRYRNSTGCRRGLVLGQFPALSLAEARLARDAARLRVSRDDADPVRERAVARQAARLRDSRPHTMDELWERYREAVALGRHRARGLPKRASTMALEESRWRTHVRPVLGARQFEDMTSGDVRDFLTLVAQKNVSHSTVNGCGALLRGVLSFAVFQEWAAANVALGHATPFVGASRDRVLSRDELRGVWTALTDPVAPGMERRTALALRFAIITLQRLGEVVGLRIEEIDFENRIWTIPASRSKSRRTHVVPLSDPALAVIEEARAQPGADPFIFPGRKIGYPLDRRAVTRAFKRLTAAVSELKAPATPHDLRRTGASLMTGDLDIRRFDVSRVLGHASDGGGAAAVTAVYDRHDYLREKRLALQAWCRWIERMEAGFPQDDGNVVGLPLDRAS